MAGWIQASVPDSYVGCARAVTEGVDARRSVGRDRYSHRERIAFSESAPAHGRCLGAPNPQQAIRSAPTKWPNRNQSGIPYTSALAFKSQKILNIPADKTSCCLDLDQSFWCRHSTLEEVTVSPYYHPFPSHDGFHARCTIQFHLHLGTPY